MDSKSSRGKKRERWITIALFIVLVTIGTLAPCIVMYMFATIGQ